MIFSPSPYPDSVRPPLTQAAPLESALLLLVNSLFNLETAGPRRRVSVHIQEDVYELIRGETQVAVEAVPSYPVGVSRNHAKRCQ